MDKVASQRATRLRLHSLSYPQIDLLLYRLFDAPGRQATSQVFMGTHSQTYALIVPLFSECTRTLTFETFHQVREGFRNASVAVLGSTQRWYEAMALTKGARRVVTIQHNAVSYRHPALHAYTHRAFFASKERPETFDVIPSISSFEHHGLGRYGDPWTPTETCGL